MAGVSVDQQGDPGSTAIVRIRGFGTNGNNDPLYVIDGVQMRGGNNLINPNDIETLDHFKRSIYNRIVWCRRFKRCNCTARTNRQEHAKQVLGKHSKMAGRV